MNKKEIQELIKEIEEAQKNKGGSRNRTPTKEDIMKALELDLIE